MKTANPIFAFWKIICDGNRRIRGFQTKLQGELWETAELQIRNELDYTYFTIFFVNSKFQQLAWPCSLPKVMYEMRI